MIPPLIQIAIDWDMVYIFQIGNIYGTNRMPELIEYLDDRGRSPFARWYKRLDAQTAVRIRVALGRLEQDGASDIKGLEDGVFEYRLHFGAGYRVYFGKEGDELIILLVGGSKQRQSADIKKAKQYWRDYLNQRG